MKPKKERDRKIVLITIKALRESQQPRIRCPCFFSLSLLPGIRGVESTMIACGRDGDSDVKGGELVIICNCVVAEMWLLAFGPYCVKCEGKKSVRCCVFEERTRVLSVGA